jgi:hypothetical protein
MNKQEFLDKYFPDYREKGLNEPKFNFNDKVLVIDNDEIGTILDIDTTEKRRPIGDLVEWIYYVELCSFSCRSFLESELCLWED